MASEGRRELSDELGAQCGLVGVVRHGCVWRLTICMCRFYSVCSPRSLSIVVFRPRFRFPPPVGIPCKFYFGPVLLVLRLSSAVYVWQLGSDRWSSCRRRLASKMMMALLSAGMGRTGKPQAQAMQGEPMFKVPSLSYPGHAPSQRLTHLNPP